MASSTAYAGEYQFSGRLSTTIWDQYLGESGGVARRAPVLQTDLYLQLPHGFYFEPWVSTDFNRNFSDDFGKEIDWNIGWTGKVKEFNLDIGASYFDIARLFSLNGPIGDIVEVHGEVNKRFTLAGGAHTLTPFLRVEGKLPLKEQVSKGAYTIIGLRHNWQVTPWLRFDQSLLTFYDTGAVVFRPALMGAYQAGLNWKLSRNISLGLPQVKFSTPLIYPGKEDARRGRAAFGASLIFEF